MKDICFSISYLTILITLWILRLLSSSNSNFHQEVRTIDRASTTNRHLRPLPPKHRLPRTSSTRPSFSPSRGEGGQGFPQFTHQSSANSHRLAGPSLHLLAGQGENSSSGGAAHARGPVSLSVPSSQKPRALPLRNCPPPKPS